MHVGVVTLLPEQSAPQAPQWRGSVSSDASQPSVCLLPLQSAKSWAQVIWQTPPYPDYQWTIRGDVDARWGAGFADRVRQALLEMNDPALLETFPRSRFIPASNDDYEPIVRTARELDLID